MKTEAESVDETDLPTLLTGIVADAQTLFGQQVDLLRSELVDEFRQATAAGVSLGAGVGLAATGGALSAHMLVHLLHKTTRLPLWASYGMVAGIFGAVGARLIYSGKQEITNLSVLPTQTAEAVKENVAWLKDQTAGSQRRLPPKN